MGLRALESEITAEAREVLENPKLRVKDIQEWKTGGADACTFKPHEGEVAIYLPALKVWVAVLAECDKRKERKP